MIEKRNYMTANNKVVHMGSTVKTPECIAPSWQAATSARVATGCSYQWLWRLFEMNMKDASIQTIRQYLSGFGFEVSAIVYWGSIYQLF